MNDQYLLWTVADTASHECMMCCEGAWPEHHCKVADGALLNETIPKEEDGSYSKCKMYDADERNKTIKCDQWEYFGYIHDTIVSEVIELRYEYTDVNFVI